MYLTAKSFQSEILDSWKNKKGKFVRTFGMNSTRNENKWRASWASIKENIHTAIGMPGIAYEECDKSGCSLTHVEADTYEENVEKQKPFIKTKIIDYVIDEDQESVDLVHEIIDESFFEELKRVDSVKFVSPLIWPTNDGITINGSEKNKNGVELPIIDTHHWKFVLQAFLNEEPAYGDDAAQVKTTCEGDNCQVQMLSAKLIGDTTTANDTNLSHLQETPLLYKHKGAMHLVAASKCVKDILRKKKQDGITINDQALAIAFSECGESNKAKSSFKTCTCDDKHNNMSATEETNKTLMAENASLLAKLKAQNDEKEKEKSFEGKKGRYAKLFADTTDEDREKMVAKLKADEDKDELKAAMEVHEEMKKAKKADTDDPEKEKLEARLKAMEEEHKKPMVAKLLKARSSKVSKEDLKNYEKSLAAKSYDEVKERYDEQKPLFGDSIKDTIISDNSTEFGFNGGEETFSLKGKTFSQIEESNS